MPRRPHPLDAERDRLDWRENHVTRPSPTLASVLAGLTLVLGTMAAVFLLLVAADA